MPTARARCSAGKLDVITDSVTGMIMAAATPARIRATSRISTLVEQPPSAFAAMNRTRPSMRIGLRPHRSPIAPIGSRSAAKAIV